MLTTVAYVSCHSLAYGACTLWES